MQAKSVAISTHEPKKEQGMPDKARIKRLVDAAAEKCGGFKQLAEQLETHPQLISNWRNGVKTPSPEAQAELAQIAGHNVLIASLMALIEKTDGTRKKRLQKAYRDWTVAAAATLEKMTSLYLRKAFGRRRVTTSPLMTMDGIPQASH